MKWESLAIIVLTLVSFTLAQLPFQVKPRLRGFPKRSKHVGTRRWNIGRGAIEEIYRLNNTFIPSHYDIELRVLLDDGGALGKALTAPGKVRIVGVNQEKTSRITLHANQLKIIENSVKVNMRNGIIGNVGVKNVSEDLIHHFFIIELEKEINAGEEYEIYIEYIAKIMESEEGLFYRVYETETGEFRRVVATQLESVEARRLFPSFDEPEMKATFQLTIIHRNEFKALSNTALISSTPDPQNKGWTIDQFGKTIKMSTYLVALALTDYTYAEAFFGNRPVRTYGPKHIINAGGGNYSVEFAAKCLSFFENHFNESYMLSKMDIIAVPEFGGAMENAGLNVFGTEYLLHLPEEESESHRNLVTMVVAHELAHQWFGNLVTMKWWSEVYLTEGLTEYTQYLGMEAIAPDLNAPEAFILDAFQFSMLFDATPFTRPLAFNVSSPEEIDDMFGTISYEKGASFFRMVEAFLTKETFQKGLQIYLKKFAYSSVTQEDLFQSLQLAATEDKRLPSELSLSKIMHSWSDQSGFPLITVEGLNTSHVKISQKPFGNMQTSVAEGENAWYVPITVVTQEKPFRKNNIPEVWLEDDGKGKIIAHNTSQWIMLNNNATGFYRVLYSQSNIQNIQQQLEQDPSKISPLSRSQLLDDYFVFAKQSYVPISTTLNLTRYLHKETHFAPWGTFFHHFGLIYRRFTSHPAYPLVKKYLQPKVDNALLAIGLEESSWHKGSNDIYRADLLDWSCSLQSPLCKEYASKLFAQWLQNPNQNPITSIGSRNTLHCAMVATGGKKAYDFFLAKYFEAESDSDLRAEIISSLGCAMDLNILENLLQTSVNTSLGFNRLDTSIVLEKVASNPLGRKIILKFVSENIDYIVEEVGLGSAWPLVVVISKLSKYYCTTDQFNQVKNFTDFHSKHFSKSKSTVKSILETISENIRWMDTVGLKIWTWLWHEANNLKSYN